MIGRFVVAPAARWMLRFEPMVGNASPLKSEGLRSSTRVRMRA